MTTFDDCEQCGHRAATSPEEAVAVVATAPERYGALFAGHGPAAAAHVPAPGVWAPVSYVWHVVDVLRFGTERLWMLTLDPTSTVVPWDADIVAVARGYPRLSVAVALRALVAARDTWIDAYRATPADAAAEHPEIGRMTAAVMAERNAHEVLHHGVDIAAAFAAVRFAGPA